MWVASITSSLFQGETYEDHEVKQFKHETQKKVVVAVVAVSFKRYVCWFKVMCLIDDSFGVLPLPTGTSG